MIDHLRKLALASDVLVSWTVREIKVRYADTYLGVAWILVYPALWVVLFSLLFGRLVRVPVNGAPYPLFVLSGLAPWFFFSNAVTNAVSSLQNNANLITKIYFPREILPFASVMVGLLDLCLYMFLLIGLLAWYRMTPGPVILLLIPIVLLLACFTLGLSLLASRLALFRRDVQLLIPMALQFLMYCVPVFYPATIVPAKYRALYLLNPLAALLDAFRGIVVYNSWPDWRAVSVAGALALALLAFAYFDFKKAEPEFADRL